jgi:hypothetical protein
VSVRRVHEGEGTKSKGRCKRVRKDGRRSVFVDTDGGDDEDEDEDEDDEERMIRGR